jgi:hypothetical protein
MALRGRLKRLEQEREGKRWELLCPECGWEITVRGDVPLDLVVYQWEEGSEAGDVNPGKGYDPNLTKLIEHEHDANLFLEKKSGLWMYEQSVSGMNPDKGPGIRRPQSSTAATVGG